MKDVTLRRYRQISDSLRRRGRALKTQYEANPARALASLGLLVLFLGFMLAQVFSLAPRWWLYPSLRMTLQTDQPGHAQVFFDQGKGFSEDNSVFVDLRPGVEHKLVFSAKERAQIANLRFDPSNVAGAKITVRNVRLCGPLGLGERNLGLKALEKPNGFAEVNLADGVLTLVNERADAWLMVRAKKTDLGLPVLSFGIAPLILFLGTAAFTIWVYRILIPWEGSWLTFLAHGLALIFVVFLLSFFATPTRTMDSSWFFPAAWIAQGVFLAALARTRGRRGLEGFLRQPTILLLMAFLLYFGLRIAVMNPENHAPKGEVLHTLLFWGFSGVVFAAAVREMTFSRDGLYRLARLWWLVAACAAVANMVTYYAAPGRPSFPEDRLIYGFNPLFPAIVGSACYALPMLLCAVTAPVPKTGRAALRFLLHLAAILVLSVFIAQCMSRTVVYALILALAGGLGANLIRRRPGQTVGLACALAVTFALSFTALPSLLSGASKAMAAAPAANVPPSDWTEFEDQNLGGRNRMMVTEDRRQAIWAAYWKASQRRLLLGHGFKGTQGVIVEKFAEMGLFQDGIPKPTSAHSLYMSALYYGGLLGLLITAGLPLSVFICSAIYFLRTRDPWQLVPAMFAVIGGLLLAGECAIIAQLKENVLCWHPNGYWVAAWGTFLLGIIQQSFMSKPSPHGN